MSARAAYTAEISGIRFTVFSAPGLFSPSSLDTGTRLLLETVQILPGIKVLDLGCGCGPMGIFAALCGAHVTMTDIEAEAIEACRRGLSENGVAACLTLGDAFEGVEQTGFDLILSNPPYHADYSVAKRFIEKGFNRLKTGGKLALVVKRPLWYEKKLRSIFGGVKITQRDGYNVLISEKRSDRYANKYAVL